ncbi:baseplate J/gp47 family protein [Brevibacillus sp. WF146]|nr:baseplate J/gp47 family protein [Brevibacillus sp. WF146]UYZ15649.1 baseplate J/gp47 family protein [Brevibacillus sp. WF146]
MTRKPAVKATGFVTFTGNEGTVIPKGTEVYTDGDAPIYFVTTADATITNGTATVAAEAKEAGATGNVGPGAIKLTTGNITGITGVTNTVAFDGGVDAESNETSANATSTVCAVRSRQATRTNTGNGRSKSWASGTCACIRYGTALSR